MNPSSDLSLTSHFASIPDPRIDRTKKHLLGDHPHHRSLCHHRWCRLLAGSRTLRPRQARLVADLPRTAQRHPLARHLPPGLRPHRPQGVQPLRGRLDGHALCQVTGLRHVAIDGKAARAAQKDTFCGCLFLVNAWAVENRIILGQAAVAEGTNETGTVPELLEGARPPRGVGDAGCRRVPAGVRRDDPPQGGGLFALRQGEPGGAGDRHPGGLRSGRRGGLRRDRPRRPRWRSALARSMVGTRSGTPR